MALCRNFRPGIEQGFAVSAGFHLDDGWHQIERKCIEEQDAKAGVSYRYGSDV